MSLLHDAVNITAVVDAVTIVARATVTGLTFFAAKLCTTNTQGDSQILFPR